MALLHIIQTVITLLIVLSILVVAHEWGHFIVARIFGIRVDDFSIGFGKRLVRLAKRGDTEYNLRMLPLGGFVKIAGMAADEEPLVRAKDKVVGRKPGDPDASEFPLVAENTPEKGPEGALYDAPDSFANKPLWQRSLVIFAGPLMSFLFGYIVFCLVGVTLGWPTGALLNKVDQVEPGGEGQHIGLRTGDQILAINGQPTPEGKQMVELIRRSPNIPITLTVQRNSRILTLHAVPRPALDPDNKPEIDVDVANPEGLAPAFAVQKGDALLGIDETKITSAQQADQLLASDAGKHVTLVVRRALEAVPLEGTVPKTIAQQLPALSAHPAGILKFSPAAELKRSGFLESIEQGNRMIVIFFSVLGDLAHRHELQKSAGGIILMYQATGMAVQGGPLKPQNLFKTTTLAAQLSISLAIFNLLPIPVLDGGHLLTFFIEWIRRGKKLTPEQQQAFLMTGLAIIGILFVLVVTNDILRTVHHELPQ